MADISMRILLSAQDTASSVIKGVGSSISSLGGFMGPVGMAVAAVGAAVIGVGIASTKMAADYQQSMLKVQALTGSSNQQMAQYDTGLKALAVNAGVAPKALSDGLYNVLSAGYAGADAMKVLTLATEDSKIGMTDAATTTNALTNVMANFKISAAGANVVNGEMLQTVTLGKATFAQYASNITKAASTSSQFGVSMETMNAAWATLTASGISAGMATTDYDQSLKVMDSNIGTVTKSLHKNGIAFDETKFNAMSYGDKVQYLDAALQKANDAHVKITGATIQASQAIHTISQHIGTYNSDLATLSNKQAMAQKTQEAWGITQQGFNQQMSRLSAAVQVLMINIGQQLLPVLTKIAGAVIPVVTQFAQWITTSNGLGNSFSWLGNIIKQVQGYFASDAFQNALADFQTLATQVGQHLVPVMQQLGSIAQQLLSGALKGIGTLFTTILIPAADNVAHAISLIIGPTHAAGTALAWVAPLATRLGTVLQGVGVFLQTTFKPVWDQLVSTFNSEVKPAWNDLMKSIQPILPELKMFAEFIGGMVVGSLILLVGIIGGVLHGLSSFLSGIISIFGGAVSVVSGAIKVISGIVAFFVDLLTGHFNKLGTDLGTIMNGIGTMFHGVWEIIKGIFQAAGGFIVGFVKGFIDTVVGIFHNLSDTLVGHSIIPDMINAIVSWFTSLPGKAVSALTSIIGLVGSIFNVLSSAALVIIANFVSGLINWFSQIGGRVGSILNQLPGIVTGALGAAASAALAGGANIVNSIASGIQGAIGVVGTAIGNVVSFISAHLPHSPAKIGPLTTLPQVGPEIVKQISDGMVSATPYLQTALGQVLSPITTIPDVPVASIAMHSGDSGVLADQLSFEHLVTDIYRGKRKPVDTRAEKHREAAQYKASSAAVSNDFKGVNAQLTSLQKREAEKLKQERAHYTAQIKAIEAHGKHLKGSAKKIEEAQLKAIREQEKLQIANERKTFDAKIKADRKKEQQLAKQINLTLHVHADSIASEQEMQRVAEYTIKHFSEQLRSQFANI